ncbi:MAG: YecA family protein [Paracoccaceae bacterium]
MSKRSVGVYFDETGEILVSFEAGQAGVPLKSLLPAHARGAGFDDFDVSGYFALARMVLATPEDMRAFARQLKQAPAQQPHRDLPPINPTALELCLPNGALDPERTAAVFEVVTAYWEQRTPMGIKAGLVATLWRRKATPLSIIAMIQAHSHLDPTTDQPVIALHQNVETGVALFAALLPQDLPCDQVTQSLLKALMGWISPIPVDPQQPPCPKLNGANLMFLGLTDEAGTLNRRATEAARGYIWPRIEQPPEIHGLWRHVHTHLGHYPAQASDASFDIYNSRIADLYDCAASNTTIAQAVTQMAKTGDPTPTHHLCVAAWMLSHLERAGHHRASILQTFNHPRIDWLASQAADDLLSTIFPGTSAPQTPGTSKPGRNDPCPCGSNQKYKKCCGR